ncbi:MAG: tagaturonate epimerase family protein, partial [bacterium]
MSPILEFLRPSSAAGFLPTQHAFDCARRISSLVDLEVYPRSVASAGGTMFALGRTNDAKALLVLRADPDLQNFQGVSERLQAEGKELVLSRCEMTGINAKALRGKLPFLTPKTLGLNKSAGCGDRLGLATPGHIRAARAVADPGISLILAQQSMRENERTGRNPQGVVDDAIWGVLQEGWDQGYGADADHLKTTADIDLCVDAGYTFFTIDPGDHVDDGADSDSFEELLEKSSHLPWSTLETTLDDLKNRLASTPVDLGGLKLLISEEEVTRAAVKYGRALAHTVAMYRHLATRCEDAGLPFELEMSVDETATMTSTAEHVYLASELRRLNVKWVSLAPRYLGRFEKGVDYLGDPSLDLSESLRRFRKSFAEHVAVAQTYGPYKLSLHSGSDKFSVYPIVAELAGDLVHLKTAGTSYLEALRTVSVVAPSVFREIAQYAQARYPEDRASYHVSAELEKMPDPASMPDDDLPGLLEDFHAREILHVTFGSVVTDLRLNSLLLKTLKSNEEGHYAALEKHFVRHL